MSKRQIALKAIPYLLAGLAGVAIGLTVAAIYGLPGEPHLATIVTGGVAAAIALLAVTMSFFTIRAGRHNAKATVTFQHIARTQIDGDMIKARQIMRDAEKKGNLAQYATDQTGEVAQAVNLILNDMEIVSIGIQRGIIDCALFRAWCESATVSKWTHWEPYVVAMRRELEGPRIFMELQKMATAWDKARPGYKHDPDSSFCQ